MIRLSLHVSLFVCLSIYPSFVQLLEDTKLKSKTHSEGLKQRFKERYTEATDMLKSRLQKYRQEVNELKERLQQEEVCLSSTAFVFKTHCFFCRILSLLCKPRLQLLKKN